MQFARCDEFLHAMFPAGSAPAPVAPVAPSAPPTSPDDAAARLLCHGGGGASRLGGGGASRLGPFEMSETLLGEGGFGRVMLARHAESGEHVAVKMMAISSLNAAMREIHAMRVAGTHEHVCGLRAARRRTWRVRRAPSADLIRPAR